MIGEYQQFTFVHVSSTHNYHFGTYWNGGTTQVLMGFHDNMKLIHSGYKRQCKLLLLYIEWMYIRKRNNQLPSFILFHCLLFVLYLAGYYDNGN